MLVFLLDENISDVVADQIALKRPDIAIHSVHTWERGRLREKPDRAVLMEAAQHGFTLVTYDIRTIPDEIRIAYDEERDLGGVIFVDHRTIPQSDRGGLILALIALWDARGHEDWTNRVEFLTLPA